MLDPTASNRVHDEGEHGMMPHDNEDAKQKAMPEWYHVDELLPEDCPLCGIYKEGTFKCTTVLAMDKHGRMGVLNRMNVKKHGNPFLDRLATDGWEWGQSGIVPEYWYPIPLNEKLRKDGDDDE